MRRAGSVGMVIRRTEVGAAWPLLDMPHAAYPAACRVRAYAAWVFSVAGLAIRRISAFGIVWCSLRWVLNSPGRTHDHFGPGRRVSPVSGHRTWTGRANDRAL